uniref:colicin release lysis protein n=1 Tax=Escherichia coli TaxID=562 RepID=UPI0035D4A529
MKKKIGGSMILVLAVLCLTACQANYVRDVQGGTIAPSSWGPLGKRKISHAKTVFCTIRYRHCV